MCIQSHNSFGFTSCWAISWQQATFDPGNPKQSSDHFPVESGLQSLIFCVAPPSHPGCSVYLQQIKEERIWTGQHGYTLVPTFPVVEMSLLSGGPAQTLCFGPLLQLLPVYRGLRRENLTTGIHSVLADLFHLDLKLAPLPHSQH